MGIRTYTTNLIIFFLALVLGSCIKKNQGCSKMGYEYISTISKCWYRPLNDSILLNTFLTVEASIPKTFIDEGTNSAVINNSNNVEGPFQIMMLYPMKEGAIENFEIISKIGQVKKDSINYSQTQLKNFRTIIWDGNTSDSFKIKLELKPLVRGVYGISIGRQSSRDSDCALHKYFLKVGNADQHLNYLAQYNNGYISDYERNYVYCFKVY